MSPREPVQRLGRGLAALLGDAAMAPDPAAGGVRTLPLDLLDPSPFQPRTAMDPAALGELAESIRARGLLQPLLVRPNPADPARFQIIAGERRWRAAGLVGLHEVPALVRPLADGDAMAAALVENLQRQDLNPLEEAEGYNRLLDEFGLTQETLAAAVGKSRGHISNTMRLLALTDRVRDALRAGTITAGHARALVGHRAPDTILAMVLERGLSVRQTEALAAKLAADLRSPTRSPRLDPDLQALERELSELLGLRVDIMPSGRGGAVRIRYADLDQLDALLAVLRAPTAPAR
ncbi:MAG: ParB/RepB/Spo0J family partition protein [Rhodospirillales bacterium]|nr:ParB/RepB/Spo0J family partition protein [Rhodospirillales bacterium]